ncbi:type I-F CRISPR-associated helicase Cas3f [Orbaceae bacterium ac157xtp]
MNILLISQCQKNALKETRRIIDQFAERCGERTWQTAITQAGLETLRKLLRKTARKNTAVACYWTRGKNKTELLWIVGDRKQFNDQGRVPTNRSKRDILRSNDENAWQHATSIQIIATLAALLHDLGKATCGFQAKLQKFPEHADIFRHEWISLQLFILMVADCKTNKDVLDRLANFAHYQQQNPNWYKALEQIKNQKELPLDKKPTIVTWIGWLIVSHHRMPLTFADEAWNSTEQKFNKTKSKNSINNEFEPLTSKRFFKRFTAVSKWIWNPLSAHPKPQQFWKLAENITSDKDWQKSLTRWANKALNHPNLFAILDDENSIDPFLLHMTRLVLMTGDHNYSNVKIDREQELHCHQAGLVANTKSTNIANQLLSQHLLGVAQQTASFARLLPKLSEALPSLHHVKALMKPTLSQRFYWQNNSYQLAKSYNEEANEAGFFGVNMASTGCGKTIANSRIMYALHDSKKGARFTIALGLRVLTLQTGQALRKKLGFNDQQLAVLVGGQATKKLFEIKQNDNGSESQQELITEFIDVDESAIDDQQLGTIIESSKAKALLYMPIVTCTIDHLIQASESQRGGKQITPQLRLLTSDLILDEPDDFDHRDLPALARLVHLAGLFGSKVLLSSATLTPDLIQGLFSAYQAGRKIWQKQQQRPEQPIVCGWFDEFNQHITCINDNQEFSQTHQHYIENRSKELAQQFVRRKGTIMALQDYTAKAETSLKEEGESLNYRELAQDIIEQACQLHNAHHNIHPKTQQKVSIGLLRFAHTKSVVNIARAMYQFAQVPEDTQLHIVVYHAKQVLLLRSQLEQKLDRILNRTQPDALFCQPEIATELAKSNAKNHLFMIIATPVIEVGRDFDADWAIVEPSSMRSLVQLVGRIWRHRPEKQSQTPNIAILPSNLKALAHGANLGINTPCFKHPGFETDSFLLQNHKTSDIIPDDQLCHITALPRINRMGEGADKSATLAELEHKVMAHLFNIDATKQANAVTGYWQPDLAYHYCHHLQKLTPFRQSAPEKNYIAFFNGDDITDLHFIDAENTTICHYDLNKTHRVDYIHCQAWDDIFNTNPAIKPWLTMDLATELKNLKKQPQYQNWSLEKLAITFATISLADRSPFYYHPWIGVYY